MKPKRIKLLFIALCIVVTMACSITLLAQSTTSASKIGEMTNQELCNIVIENESATDEIIELDRRKKLQEQQEQEALTAFIKGMTAVKEGRFEVAGQELKKADKCPLIRDEAETILKKPGLLSKIKQECSKYEKKRLCKSCSGSGLECCDFCFGIGEVPCPKCQGTGKFGGYVPQSRRGSTSSFNKPPPCTNCGGSGCIPCPKCGNKPVRPCENCHQETGGLLDTDDYADIDTLLGAIGYLQKGGIDFFSEDALKPLLMTTQ